MYCIIQAHLQNVNDRVQPSAYLCGDGGESEEEDARVHVRVEAVGVQVGLAALLEGAPERVLLPIRTHEPVAHTSIHHLAAT